MSLHKVLSSKSNKSGQSQWTYASRPSEITLDGEESAIYRCFPLRLIKNRRYLNPKRPAVVATIVQRASFYQYQVNTAGKSSFNGCTPHLVTNLMLVALCACLTLGAVGTYFVHVFYGVYACEQHLFISKMVPLALGINVLYFFSAILDLSRFTDLSMSFLDYLIFGIYNRAPWNRCSSFNFTILSKVIDDVETRFECINIRKFRSTILTSTNFSTFKQVSYGAYSCYKIKGIENCLQLPQIVYMEKRNVYMRESLFTLGIYTFFLWGGCILASKQIYRQLIWKMMLYADMCLCTFYLFAILHTIFFSDNTPHLFEAEEVETYIVPLWELVELLGACFVFSPPLLHFMAARCKKVKPGVESFAMTLSIVGHTIFFIVANFLVHNHSISKMGGLTVGSMFISTYSYMNIHFWLVYFGTMAPGNFFALAFLAINFMMEYITMVITFDIFVEIYSMEYKWAKRWIVVIAIIVISIVNYAILREERHIVQFLARMTILILESVLLYLFYPFRRLVDDMTFFYGQSPSKMRYFSIIASVVIEMILVTVVLGYVRIAEVISFISLHEIWDTAIYITMLSIMFFPLVFGITYMVFKYIFFDQKGWTLLFVPVEEWGPNTFVARQLRKQFDSNYIACHAPKVLSRYLMRNAEPDTYKLDIVYDPSRLDILAHLWRIYQAR